MADALHPPKLKIPVPLSAWLILGSRIQSLWKVVQKESSSLLVRWRKKKWRKAVLAEPFRYLVSFLCGLPLLLFACTLALPCGTTAFAVADGVCFVVPRKRHLCWDLEFWTPDVDPDTGLLLDLCQQTLNVSVSQDLHTIVLLLTCPAAVVKQDSYVVLCLCSLMKNRFTDDWSRSPHWHPSPAPTSAVHSYLHIWIRELWHCC